MTWFDRVLRQSTPEQLITHQLRTLLQLQQETNLLLRELILAQGRTPTTMPTLLVGDFTHTTTRPPGTTSPTVTRVRGIADISSTNDPPGRRPPSVEHARAPEDPNDPNDQLDQ